MLHNPLMSSIKLLAVLMLVGCSNQSTPFPTSTPMPFERDFQVMEFPDERLATAKAEKLEIVPINDLPSLEDVNMVENPSGTFRAFELCDFHCSLVVEDADTQSYYEVQGIFLPWRGFSDIAWLSDEILAFDQWSNPHHGVHYEINFVEGKILFVSIIKPVD